MVHCLWPIYTLTYGYRSRQTHPSPASPSSLHHLTREVPLIHCLAFGRRFTVVKWDEVKNSISSTGQKKIIYIKSMKTYDVYICVFYVQRLSEYKSPISTARWFNGDLAEDSRDEDTKEAGIPWTAKQGVCGHADDTVHGKNWEVKINHA